MQWVEQALAFFLGVVATLSGWVGGLSHVVSYVAEPLAPPKKEVSIIFGGDAMFDRSIRIASEREGGDFIFSCIKDMLMDADLAVVNLEGPITSTSSVSVGSTPGGTNNFTFTFPTSTAELLKRHNIGLVNLGNNHIMNFSREGLIETKDWLDMAGVRYFGDPMANEAGRVAHMQIGAVPISFVNWSDWTSDKTDHTVAQVRAEKSLGNIVIVYTHWGEEYVPATERMKVLAHQFVDAGADIVIGSHPHVVQEHEVYAGKHIYYSLGNFIFDQYWEDAVRNGLLIKVHMTASGVQEVEEIPVRLERDRRTCLRD